MSEWLSTRYRLPVAFPGLSFKPDDIHFTWGKPSSAGYRHRSGRCSTCCQGEQKQGGGFGAFVPWTFLQVGQGIEDRCNRWIFPARRAPAESASHRCRGVCVPLQHKPAARAADVSPDDPCRRDTSTRCTHPRPVISQMLDMANHNGVGKARLLHWSLELPICAVKSIFPALSFGFSRASANSALAERGPALVPILVGRTAVGDNVPAA